MNFRGLYQVGSFIFIMILPFILKSLHVPVEYCGIIANTTSAVLVFFLAAILLINLNKSENHFKFMVLFFVFLGLGDFIYGIVNYYYNASYSVTLVTLFQLIPYVFSMLFLAIFSVKNAFFKSDTREIKVTGPIFLTGFGLFFITCFRFYYVHMFEDWYHRPWFIPVLSWIYGIFQAVAVGGLVVSIIRTMNMKRIIAYSCLIAMMGVDLVLRYQDLYQKTYGTLAFEFSWTALLLVVFWSFYFSPGEIEDREPVYSLKAIITVSGLIGIILISSSWFLFPVMKGESGVFYGAEYIALISIFWGGLNIFSVFLSKSQKTVIKNIIRRKPELGVSQTWVTQVFGLKDLIQFMGGLQEKIEVLKAYQEEVKPMLAQAARIPALVHDLAVPMSAIKSAVSMNKDVTDDDLVKKMSFANRILRSFESSIEDLDSMTTIESALPDERTHLVELMEDSIRAVKIHFEQQGKFNLDFKLDNKTNVEEVLIKGSYKMLSKSFINLIKNAGESMAGAGVVKIEIFQSSKEAIIKIADSGRGMSSEELLNYGAVSFTRTSGKGIGAIVTKKTIESFGGRLLVVSHEEVGTTIDVILPKVIIQSSAKAEAAQNHPDKMRRLVVIDNNLILHDYWKNDADSLGILYLTVSTRAEYEAYLECASTEDIVVIDRNLGWADGVSIVTSLQLKGFRSITMTTGGRSGRKQLQEAVSSLGIKVLDKAFPLQLFA